MRIHPQVHAQAAILPEALRRVPAQVAAGGRDLQGGKAERVRIGREGSPGVLSEPVPPRQVVLGSQDAVLRRGSILFLRHHRGGRRGGAHSGILFEGEGVRRGLQPGVHTHVSAVSKVRVRQVHHQSVVRAFQTGGQAWLARKTAERPREDIVSQLLDARVADVIQFADGGGERSDQGYFVDDGNQDGGYYQYVAEFEYDQVLEGTACGVCDAGLFEEVHGAKEEDSAVRSQMFDMDTSCGT
mmetsp:Transcript_18453/g.40113  ORF Transcript_18453/g.40113 Transcript_18453/m.40113 type:complete len:242 (-) Transcript_18453:303-1028(-)